jgi:hypothetical protein
MGALEAVGRALGGVAAPVAWEGSLIRRARLFHPDGDVYRAEVRPLVAEGPAVEIAQRLAGPALVRLSGGWWRWRRHRDALPDVLGMAVRFCASEEMTARAAPGDQDLLLATFRHLWSLPVALFTTNARDFLANPYYAVLPFEVPGLGRTKWRIAPPRTTASGGDRRERLERAVASGLAVLRLEARPLRRSAGWTAVAEVTLRERVLVDQEELRFNPFRTGRGLVPSGLVQAARAATYMASQVGRAIAGGPSRSPI